MEREELDVLKVRVFEYVYYKLVHKIVREKEEEELKSIIASLDEDDKAYIQSFVVECMQEFMTDKTPAMK